MYSSKKSGNIILKDHNFNNFREMRINGFWPKSKKNESMESNAFETTKRSNMYSKWDPNTSRFLNDFDSYSQLG